MPIQLQLEFIEVQASSVCKIKHRKSSLLDFYRSLNSDRYKKTLSNSQRNAEYFWQYLHIQTNFSIMNMNKNKQGSSLSNKSLEDILKISTFPMYPDYNKLVAGKRCNISH